MSESVRDYNKLAHSILKLVGKDNVSSAAHCATRLRLVLKKSLSAENKKAVGELPGVITVVENGGQFQIVIGPHVTDVYDVFKTLLPEDNLSDEEPNQGVVSKVVATMSAVFAPFIYILAAAGILQGALILINLAVPSFAKTGTYQVFNLMSWAPFTFLPILIAVTAAKHFKVNTFIALACCAALVSPSMTELATQVASGKHWTLFGMAISPTTYTSTVLPPLILVWLLSYVQRYVEKKVPGVVKELLTPLICLVVMVPLTVLILGPASSYLANAVANSYNWLVKVAPPLAAAIIGGFWQVIVIFGVHWGITPVIMANFANYGHDSFQAFQAIAVTAQVTATLGVFFKTNSKQLKGVSLSAFITGLFGITEPAIYGVTLRLKRPFIYGCISGAIGAVVASLFKPLYFAYAGLPSILTSVNAINKGYPLSFIGEIVGLAVAVACALGLVFVLGTGETKEDDKKLAAETATTPASEPKAVVDNKPAQAVHNVKVPAPLSGQVMPLSKVPDEVFASGAMGPGLAIVPDDNKVYAPFDGKVEMLVNSGHAIGIISDSGVELLIHVGLDTVKMGGKPYKYLVKANQAFKQGDELMEFDMDAIKQAGFSNITPIIVTNASFFNEVQPNDDERKVTAKDESDPVITVR